MKELCAGVDLGGTTVKLGLFKTRGEVIEKWEIPTDKSEKGSHILPDIAKSLEEKMKERGISRDQMEGVGLCVPGPVRPDGSVSGCVNIGWGEVDVKSQMESLLSLPVEVGNDANVAALGEMWQGGAKGYDNVLLVTLGTGVGGGLIIGGRIVAGAHGAGAEIGHLTIEPDEKEFCNCGRPGCLEYYASATGAVRLAKRRMEAEDTPSSLRKKENLTAKDVFDAAKEEDALALAVEKEYWDRLGYGLSIICTVCDPAVIVFGGGVSRVGDRLTEGVRAAFRKYAFPACRETRFALATLGNDAGIFGCARMVCGG
ncbi:MAG: ROK family glucokinase [Lachnospiraceae bacterium]|nr:ROK family glucokinase [Lachnospiraceae bacterium]